MSTTAPARRLRAPFVVPAPAPIGGADAPARLSTLQRRAIAGTSILVVAVLIALEVLAIGNHYAMRVTADTPTFMALIRDLAIHPFRPDSVFFGTVDTRSIHASPYLQMLALVWKLVASHSQRSSPLALGRFVAVVTIPVTLFVLSMLWLYVKQLAGATAASIAVIALLVVFGPVHIAFPSDLTLNGFMSTGYFPTTFATGLTLAVLLTLRKRSWRWSLLSIVLTALTLSTDPLNGAVLVVLMIACACTRVTSEVTEGLRIPLVLMWAFLLASAWPTFDVWQAFGNSGLPVPALLLAAFATPFLWLGSQRRLRGAVRVARRVLSVRVSAATELRVAWFGAWSAAMITLWGISAMRHWPTGIPVLQSYRLGFYWNDQRDRWLLLLLPGACGLIGLLRLARRNGSEVLMWFAGFLAAGLAGAIVHLAVGFQLPFYYRFILLCQVPLAIGVGAFVAHHKSRGAGRVVVVMLACAFAFKALTLLTVSPSLNYFGSELPSVWKMGQVIPPHSGVVASDANTSYFMPVATRNPVLTLGLGHADSGTESQRAESGYALLRDVYEGSPGQAAGALERMWADGVRWVIVEKFTTFAPVDLKHLFAAPYNSLIVRRDIAPLATYNSRLSAVASQVFDDGELTVYRLNRAELAYATHAPASLATRDRPQIQGMLQELAQGDAATAARAAPRLYRLGVRRVTLSVGTLGATPQLSAYGQSLRQPDVVTLTVSSGRWRTPCKGICAGRRDTAEIEALGRVLHEDPRFTTIVALEAPK